MDQLQNLCVQICECLIELKGLFAIISVKRGIFSFAFLAISCFLPDLWVPECAVGVVQTSFIMVGSLCIVWELCDVQSSGTHFIGY